MILVSKTNFEESLAKICKEEFIGLDTETTGLYPFHGDRLFSLILAIETEVFYFNFKEYEGLADDLVLDKSKYLPLLQKELFNDIEKYYFIHNSIFDCPILAKDGVDIKGVVHCTMVGEIVDYNLNGESTRGLGLDKCARRIKLEKDDRVGNYIKEHNLYSFFELNGHKVKKKRYDLVPFPLISEYGCKDGRIVYLLGKNQLTKIKKKAEVMEKRPSYWNLTVFDTLQMELKLQKVIHRLQMLGMKLDVEYCKDSLHKIRLKIESLQEKFKKLTGIGFVDSAKCFEKALVKDKAKWQHTEKGNLSFDKNVLENFESEESEIVKTIRKWANRKSIFANLLKYRDENDIVHTSMKSYGAVTGRISCSNPPLQTLEKQKKEIEVPIRRALIPRDNYFFLISDFRQIEYRVMIQYANPEKVIDMIIEDDMDFHGVISELSGVPRDDCKNVNFLTLYGGSTKALAKLINTTEKRAQQIQNTIFRIVPEIKQLRDKIKRVAENRKWVHCWSGRISFFPDRRMCYKALNSLAQGGAADICKKAMIAWDKILRDTKSNFVLQIHDELIAEIHYDDIELIKPLHESMVKVFPHKNLPMACSVEYSLTSLQDKKPIEDVYGLVAQKYRPLKKEINDFLHARNSSLSRTPTHSKNEME